MAALVYVAIIQVGGLVIGAGISADASLETTGNFARVALVPIALSALYAVGLATWLGWWPRIIRDDRPVRGWVGIIPVLLLAAAAAGASWANLLGQAGSLVLAFIVLVILVGFTEELMFRGIGVVTFRQAGFAEAKVALYTSVIFGVVHLSNAISTGPSALLQATIVSLTGYFLYLTRRRAGVIWAAMAVHSSQDFALLSGQIGVGAAESPASLLVVLAMVVSAILLWRGRHRIEPNSTGADFG